jgi:thymidylate synthase (FAD)
MKVTLLANTPEPEKLIAAAARLCYSDKEVSEIMENFTEEKIDKFINKLISLGHESPLEHVSFTFGVEGISRACSHQLVRHRIASYSQKSQRYVSEYSFDYVIPPEIENSIYKSEYERMMSTIQDFYNDLRAMGLEPEDARMVLPNACTTSIIVTMNVRSLLNFFKHRDCKRAQWEIREMAQQMMEVCQVIAPRLFARAGASCRHGKCSEDSMSCGEPYN